MKEKDKMNNKELAIVNHLKLQPYKPKDDPPTIILLSDEEISIATKIKEIRDVRKVLAGLEAKGVVARDKYGNWGLSDRVISSETSSSIELEVKSIRIDGGTQPRAEINKKHVLLLEEQISEGGKLEAIVVFYDGENYWVADGFHRIKAHLNQGKQTIRSIVKQGTRKDAVLYSVGANAEHKAVLARSRADKRRAVITLLSDEEWQQWSNYKIAAATKVNEKTVRNIRKDLTTDIRSEKKTRTYQTKHGSIATMNTANIGKTPSGELVEGAKVKVKDGYGVRSGQIGTISYFPNNGNALVAFEDDRTELIPKNQLEVVDEGVGDRALGVGKSPEPTPQTQRSEINSVDRELADKQEELGLGRGGDSALPPSDRLDKMQHSNPTDVDDRPFANPIITEVNPNAVLSSFINGLQFLGNEQIEVATRAIAKRKKEAVSKAAYGLADSEDEAVEIIKAIASKYPNAINLAIEF